ncbi:MAG: complex I subunit 4 family protein, partial [Bdellovibrio bacteriovorus]
MDLSAIPLLSLLLLTLPVGAALIWLIPDQRWARAIALGATLADLAISLLILTRFDPADPGFQLVERQPWIPTLNIHYAVGVDGIAVLFLPLAALLFIGVILTSWTQVRTMQRLYYTLLLLLESTTLGIFLALDTVLFFLFWELSLVPLFFLVSLWGVGANRRYAATKYTLLMLVGGIPLLFAILVLAFNHAALTGLGIPGGLSFDYEVLLGTPLPDHLELLVFALLVLGFGVKTPLFPLHTWLPLVAAEGPVAVAALMTGLKLGAFGLIRYLVPLTPGAVSELQWLLLGLGVVGLLYGALAALAQTNLRRMLAFGSMSHAGLVVLGIASLNQSGIQGALFQLLNFTVVAGGLFLLTGFLHHRTGSTEAVSLGGLARTMPLLTGFFLLLGLASIGLPGTTGFPAELLLILGTLEAHTGAGLAALFAAVLGAGYFLGLYRRLFLGPVTNPVVAQCRDLGPRELVVALALGILVLLPGLYPQGVLDLTRASTLAWVARVGDTAAQTERR